MRDDDAWFVRGRIGYSFLPVRWPGWLALGLYVAAVAGLTVLLPHRRSLFHALLAILTVLLLVITVRMSRSE